MGSESADTRKPYSLIASHRSIRRMPKTFLSSVGLNKRHGISSRRTPEDGQIFGPGGRFLMAGHTRGLTIGAPENPDHPTTLEAHLPSDVPTYRAELIPISKYLLEEKFSFFHVPLVYEFEVKLDGPSLGDPANQSIAQWHGIPNRVLGSPRNRHAPFLLAIIEGRYSVISAATRKLSPKVDASGDTLTGLDRVRRVELHAPKDDIGKWVRWRLEVCWSYKGDQGWWRLYKNGNLAAEDTGPNSYNEFRGAPYFQFGIYRLGRNLKRPQNPEPHNKRSYRNVSIRLL